MLSLQYRRLLALSALSLVVALSNAALAQDSSIRGRKYTPPPNTAKVSVAVIKDVNGKPIENAAVVFHMVGEEGKGNMELKTNEEGKAIIEVIPLGDTVTLQVIANGYQTFGEDYKIDTDSKDIIVRMKRPARQYSTYEHSGTQPGATAQPGTSAQTGNAPPAPKR
jgi:hypothetical protein